MRGIVLDRGADPRDVDVDAAIERLERFPAHQLHQRSRESTRPAFCASAQSSSNWWLVSERGSPSSLHRARVAVDLEPAEAQARRSRSGPRAPAQDRAQARQQLARAEGLREVVVGAELEADDAIGLLAARREHQDRERRSPPARGGRPRSRRDRAASRRGSGRRRRRARARARPLARVAAAPSPRSPPRRDTRRAWRRGARRLRSSGCARPCLARWRAHRPAS